MICLLYEMSVSINSKQYIFAATGWRCLSGRQGSGYFQYVFVFGHVSASESVIDVLAHHMGLLWF